MQEKSLAVNVFDEENSSQRTPEQEQTMTPAHNGTSDQPKTSDGQPFTKQVTDTTMGPGITPKDDSIATYAPWIVAVLMGIVILVALWAIIRRTKKRR